MRAESVPGRATAFGLRTLEAGAAALSGEARAKAHYRGAIAGWEGLDLPLPLLLTLAERKTFLSDAATAGGNEQAARLVERLGAKGLKRLVGP